MTINEKLAEIINAKGLKQSFVAEKTGIKADAVSRILANKRSIQADEFLKLCELLEVNPREFSAD